MSPRSSSRTPNKNADWDSACYKCVSRERVGNSTIINIPLRVRVMVVFVTAAAGYWIVVFALVTVNIWWDWWLGILDDRFDQIKELEDENPGLVVEVLTVAIRSADFTIDELEKKLSGTVIYYSKVRELTHKLKGISASVGGCRVAAACIELREAYVANNKERCVAGFDVVKREYLVLRENLNHILQSAVQIEREINANKPKSRRQ
nr:histidine-containing phosphotransfer protein 2-like [Malus domestica]